MTDVILREVTLGSSDYEQTLDLRHAVLLEPFGIPLDEAPTDDQQALHLAAFVGEACVGCLLLVDRGAGSWQLRQMAVSPELQGRGIGRQLVLAALARAREAGSTRMVAHAREPAVPFYVRLGFVVVGDPFEQVGLPHREVVRPLTQA